MFPLIQQVINMS